MYLVWLPPGLDRAEVAPLLVQDTGRRLLELGPRGLSMDLDDDAADFPAPVGPPEGRVLPRAVVSVWLDAYDRRGPFEAVLGRVAEDLVGYQVLESLYTDYGQSPWAGPRDWPDGVRSPGPLTVALFEQKPGTDYEEWLAFWHGHQSPMSEAIQPRCRYVRNTVVRPLAPGAPPYAAIVEEAWPSAADVTDPMRFYCAGDDPDVLQANVTTMLEHVTRIMDVEHLVSLTMSEWILAS
jgi:hypothetical protein